MSAIDERAQIVRLSIQSGRGVQTDAVVAPSKAARKVGNRHHFDHRHAQVRQVCQPFHGRSPIAFRRERTDVHLVDDLTGRRDTGPCGVGPIERGGVHDRRWSSGTFGLEARCRIRTQPAPVEAKPIAIAGVRLEATREVAIAVGPQRRGAASLPTAGFYDDVDRSAGGRPDAGMGATLLLDFHTKGQPPRLTLDRHGQLSRSTRRRSRPVSRAISAASCAGSTGFGKSLCTASSICRTRSSVRE